MTDRELIEDKRDRAYRALIDALCAKNKHGWPIGTAQVLVRHFFEADRAFVALPTEDNS